MKNFAELYRKLDEANKTSAKVNALVEYFKSANPEDSIWTVCLLIGRKPKQVIPAGKLKEWSADLSRIPDWLFSESYRAVGDLIETITLLLPKVTGSTNKPLHYWIEEILFPLKNKEESLKKEEMISIWNEMNKKERFVWNKLITGSFKTGVSEKLVVKALSIYSGIEEPVIYSRLVEKWKPTQHSFQQLISNDLKDSEFCKPYPFCNAHRLEGSVELLGNVVDWQAEWQWDGVRAQFIKRESKIFIWSNVEGMLNEKLPELRDLEFILPDGTVVDAEIIAWKEGRPLPLGELHKRIGRKNVTKKIIRDIPVVIIAFDLLELNGEDLREKPLIFRYKKLSELLNKISDIRLKISPRIEADTWEELKEKREESRSRFVQGLLLKRINSPYRVERIKGDWWIWKVDPFLINAVLINAHRGNGEEMNLYKDYTFGIWSGTELIPFTKTLSGLTYEEIKKIDLFVRENTIEKFGPVCTVKPELVFEIAFDEINKSNRHKSGFIVRSPRINRWRHDKMFKEADNLEIIKALIHRKE